MVAMSKRGLQLLLEVDQLRCILRETRQGDESRQLGIWGKDVHLGHCIFAVTARGTEQFDQVFALHQIHIHAFKCQTGEPHAAFEVRLRDAL